MDIEFYLHGNPMGYCIYCIGKDKDELCYEFEKFMACDNASLIVETHLRNGNIYCYYTYVMTDIRNAGGRPGSYCAITFRTSEFITDVKTVYFIMNLLFHRVVFNNLINATTRQYTSVSFEKPGKELWEYFLILFKTFICTSHIVKLDNSFLANAGADLILHPLDLDNFDVTQYKKAERLIVSPKALTPHEQEKLAEFKRKIEFVQEEAQHKLHCVVMKERDRCESMEVEIKELRNKIECLHEECKTNKEYINELVQKEEEFRAENEHLRNKICILNHELERSKSQEDLMASLASLKSPLEKINNAFACMGIRTTPPMSKNIKTRKLNTLIIMMFNAIVSMVTLSLLIFLMTKR